MVLKIPDFKNAFKIWLIFAEEVGPKRVQKGRLGATTLERSHFGVALNDSHQRT